MGPWAPRHTPLAVSPGLDVRPEPEPDAAVNERWGEAARSRVAASGARHSPPVGARCTQPVTTLRSCIELPRGSPSATVAAREIGTTQPFAAVPLNPWEPRTFGILALASCLEEPRIRSFRERASDGRATDRHRHIPVHGHRGVDAASQAATRSSPTPLGGEVLGGDCAEPGDRERPRQAEHKPSGIRTEFIPLASCTSRARIARCLCPASALPNPTRGDNAVRRSGKRRIAAADCRNP